MVDDPFTSIHSRLTSCGASRVRAVARCLMKDYAPILVVEDNENELALPYRKECSNRGNLLD